MHNSLIGRKKYTKKYMYTHARARAHIHIHRHTHSSLIILTHISFQRNCSQAAERTYSHFLKPHIYLPCFMVLKYEDISPLPRLIQNFFPKTSHSTRQIVDIRFSNLSLDPSRNHLCTNCWSGDIRQGRHF